MNKSYYNYICEQNKGKQLLFTLKDGYELIGKPVLVNDKYLIQREDGSLFDISMKNIEDVGLIEYGERDYN